MGESFASALVQFSRITRWTPPHDPTDLDLSGQTIIVTGSNTGVGKEVAIKVARQNAARVILAVRTVEKGEAVVPLVKQAAKDPKIRVDVWPLEMADYDSLKAFRKRAEAELQDGLHGLILNAGLVKISRVETKYGWETTLQVNAISTALLALMLVPILRKAKTASFKPSLVITNSGGHKWTTLTKQQQAGDAPVLEPLNKTFGRTSQYPMSKLVSMYAFRQIAQWVGEDIYVVNACPGAVTTEIARDGGVFSVLLLHVPAMLLFKSPEQGSRSIVSALGLKENNAEEGRLWQADINYEPIPNLQPPVVDKVQPVVWKELVDGWSKDLPETQEIINAARGSS